MLKYISLQEIRDRPGKVKTKTRGRGIGKNLVLTKMYRTLKTWTLAYESLGQPFIFLGTSAKIPKIAHSLCI